MRSKRRVAFFLFLMCGTGGLTLADSCPPIENVRSVLSPGTLLLLGELHGTHESPGFAADVLCHATRKKGEVILGVELSGDIQQAIDTFIDSEATEADRAALISGNIWTRSYQDGRNSGAMVDLLASVAALRRDGKKIRVQTFDATPGNGSVRDRAMAERLIASIKNNPKAIHVVLTGNAHSRTARGGRQGRDFEPMGYLVKESKVARRTIALDVSHSGGSAWICAPDCGVVQLVGHGDDATGVIEMNDDTRTSGHDGIYRIGSISASAPAVQGNVLFAELDLMLAPVSDRPTADDDWPEQDAETLAAFQGFWEAYQYGSVSWTLDVDGARFRGVLGEDDWYEGTIRVRRDKTPHEMDFQIEDCVCSYKQMSSLSIFREDDKTIVVAAPSPGSPRPLFFNKNDGTMVELRRAERPSP
ncbi:MAG: hypothetical protein OES25_14990 [Acidobacteriota bacterium]|nr:hypothetical protein [Acidobacteriota bacterium]